MWQCKQCNEKIEDTFDSCWNCGYDKAGKEIISESFTETKNETKKYLALSYKYGILRTFQSLLWFILFLSVIGGIWLLIGSINVISSWILFLYSLFLLVEMFSVFCGIKVIDFLFELDEKIDN